MTLLKYLYLCCLFDLGELKRRTDVPEANDYLQVRSCMHDSFVRHVSTLCELDLCVGVCSCVCVVLM